MPGLSDAESGVALGAVIDRLGAALEHVVATDGGVLVPDDAVGRSEIVGRAVAAVTHDSRRVGVGDLYACLPGDSHDGHDFAPQAVRDGAVALLVERRLDPGRVGPAIQLVVDDTRRRLGPVAACVEHDPSRSLLSVGVTGTNGKTTTTAMLASMFDAAGRPAGVVGTLSGPRTTPEAPELQRLLAGFVTEGKRSAVLEVSSHALALHRIDGTQFDATVFTNLGHDHLDLHGTQEEYFRAKASLFTPDFASLGIVNVDDRYGRLLADTVVGPDFEVVEYSLDDLTDVAVTAGSISYRWDGRHVEIGMGGDFNVANSLAALVTARELGIDLDDAVEGLRQLPRVPGRFEAIDGGSDSTPTVVVDYAHTPDGLGEAIAAARRVVPDGASVIVVFGCGGDRDRAKRPLMGATVATSADRVVITSDNPRTEDPQAIIDDVIGGVEPGYLSRVSTHTDRRVAITDAITGAGPDDIVLVAGKGHETYQEIGGELLDFDDREVARTVLRSIERRNGEDPA